MIRLIALARSRLRNAALLVIAAAQGAAAYAQEFPSRPIRIIVPYAPSGLPDVVARLVGQAVAADLGQQVVIDNRPGGSTVIGASLAAKAAPDGYTLFVYDVNSYAITPLAIANLPYDVLRDFAPIAEASRGQFFLVANPQLGVATVQELVALAKSQPGKINYASPGNATVHHLVMEQFKIMAGISLTHVPYKGVIQTTPALLTNEASLMFNTLPSMTAHLKAGKLRLLAAGSLQRSAVMPDVPTVAESGYPGFEVSSGTGFASPAGTPRAIIDKLNTAINRALNTPDFQGKMAGFGQRVVGGTPEQFMERVRRDREIYAKLMRAIDLKLE
ncbi:MAG: Bug family tripartite tricarboxylate transporter substrate binding protein [Burkholderiales bacterium]